MRKAFVNVLWIVCGYFADVFLAASIGLVFGVLLANYL